MEVSADLDRKWGKKNSSFSYLTKNVEALNRSKERTKLLEVNTMKLESLHKKSEDKIKRNVIKFRNKKMKVLFQRVEKKVVEL